MFKSSRHALILILFSDSPADQLMNITTKVLSDPSLNIKVMTAESLGKKQYRTFCSKRLESDKFSLYDRFKRNNISPINDSAAHSDSRARRKIVSLKNDFSLFSVLLLSALSRNFDLDNFFMHENQAVPPNLSENGCLRRCTKSDALKCFEGLVPYRSKEFPEKNRCCCR